MPPFNDIYVVTSDRSENCIHKFLSRYADLTTENERTDFSIIVAGKEEAVETGTLADTIAYGLSDKLRSFALYFNSAVRELKSVMLFFTSDEKLVLGLSVEYDSDSDEEAERVLAMLKTEFKTTLGAIAFENPPGDAYDWINENLEQI